MRLVSTKELEAALVLERQKHIDRYGGEESLAGDYAKAICARFEKFIKKGMGERVTDEEHLSKEFRSMSMALLENEIPDVYKKTVSCIEAGYALMLSYQKTVPCTLLESVAYAALEVNRENSDASTLAMKVYDDSSEAEKQAIDKILLALSGRSFESLSLDYMIGQVAKGTKVRHKEYGKGTVTGRSNYCNLYVKFETGTRIFPYPDSFEKGWLTIEDDC